MDNENLRSQRGEPACKASLKMGVQLTFAGCILSSLHTLLGRSDNDCMTSDVALEMPAKLSLRMAQEFTTFVSKRDLRAQSVGFSRFS